MGNKKDGWINDINFSPDEKYLVSGSADSSIKIWDIKSGECLKILNGHSHSVNTV
jgi:WD40 repeat protein